MTAAEYQSLAAKTEQQVADIEAANTRIRAFKYDEPLPVFPDYRARSWEPAAKHYRDIETEERSEQ